MRTKGNYLRGHKEKDQSKRPDVRGGGMRPGSSWQNQARSKDRKEVFKSCVREKEHYGEAVAQDQ